MDPSKELTEADIDAEFESLLLENKCGDVEASQLGVASQTDDDADSRILRFSIAYAITCTMIAVWMYLASTNHRYPIWFYDGLKGVVVLNALSMMLGKSYKNVGTIVYWFGCAAFAGIYGFGHYDKQDWRPINLVGAAVYILFAIFWLIILGFMKSEKAAKAK